MYDEAGSLFDRAMKPLIESIENLNGKIDQSDIEGIVLMGGSTRIPKIKELLTDFLGKFSIVVVVFSFSGARIYLSLRRLTLINVNHKPAHHILYCD